MRVICAHLCIGAGSIVRYGFCRISTVAFCLGLCVVKVSAVSYKIRNSVHSFDPIALVRMDSFTLGVRNIIVF